MTNSKEHNTLDETCIQDDDDLAYKRCRLMDSHVNIFSPSQNLSVPETERTEINKTRQIEA